MSQPFSSAFSTEVKTNEDRENSHSTTNRFFPFSPLFDAAIDDDHLSVQSLLSKSYDVNTKDADGITALHICAYFNCLTTCRTLCARLAFVNGKDNRSLTPIFYACKANHPAIVETLVEHGADCDAQNKHWQTPLHICALSKNAACAVHIISHVINVDTSDQHGLTSLHYACFSCNTEIVKLLIDNGANVNLSDRNENTPLHWASRNGSIDIINLLLNAHANPNCINNQGLTPLHLNLIGNHPDCVRKLLNISVNVNIPTHHGSLSIHLAAYMTDIDIFDQIYNRATPQSCTETDRHGNTIFHFATAAKSDDSVFLGHLINKSTCKSLINHQNSNGQTPLHIAIIHSNQAMIEQLLLAGVDSGLKDNNGNTPLHLSITNPNLSHIRSQLVSHNPNSLCETNQSGYIPLHMALNAADYQIIDCLMPEKDEHLIESAQRSLFTLDSKQRYALHYAARSGLTTFIHRYYKEVEKTIIDHQDAFGLTSLHYACFKWFGLDAIDVLLSLGANVNIRCSTYGAIPLHYILIYCYSSDAIDKLLQAGSDVLICTNHGQTSLSYGLIQNDTYLLQLLFNSAKMRNFDMLELIALACIHGNDNSLAFLLENLDSSIDLNQTMSDGMTPLMLACNYGHNSCVHLLLHRKVKIEICNPLNGMNAVHYAASKAQSECIVTLLQDVQANQEDMKGLLDAKDQKGKTALHYSVEHSSPNCIRILINFGGANPNTTDLFLLTPLHYCALYNGEESLQELLDVNDIQVQVFDKNKRLPLHYAAANGNVTILSALSDYDYVDVADIDGFSPLHYAVLRGHETAICTLLNSDIRSQCFKTSRLTPVHLACLRADSTCLKQLLHVLHSDSIDTIINLPTKNDQVAPLHLACMSKTGSDCVKQLLAYNNVDVDVQDRFQRTPIMYAIINGLDVSVIELMIDRSIHIEFVDHLQNNVLHYACLANMEPIVGYILRRYPSSSIFDDVNHENQRPLELARNSQLSPLIIDMLFALTGRL